MIAHWCAEIFDPAKIVTARKAPTRSVDGLVHERTSPAVKSALKSLLEAPSAVDAAKKTKKGNARA